MTEAQLAKQVVIGLQNDKVADIFINSTEEFRIEMVLAYAASEVRKFEIFMFEYLSKKEVRENFQRLVCSI